MKLTPWMAALFTLGVCGFAGSASADGWDSKGWTKLGERAVNGKLDRDKIEVGKYEGKLSKLTLFVDRSDLELLDFEVTFGNEERFHPEVRHTFKEGSRTRVIDLPGDDRVIKTIHLRYKNLPGGGPARVEVWGWRTEAAASPAWDSKGWTKLGERAVNGKVDRDKIEVGKYEGKFSKLTLFVDRSDLELLDLVVTFGNKERFHPAVRHTFKEGSRTRVIDLPGDDRVIKNIHLRYKNLPGGGAARVEVWGWRS
jgi:hypothetical protein